MAAARHGVEIWRLPTQQVLGPGARASLRPEVSVLTRLSNERPRARVAAAAAAFPACSAGTTRAASAVARGTHSDGLVARPQPAAARQPPLCALPRGESRAATRDRRAAGGARRARVDVPTAAKNPCSRRKTPSPTSISRLYGLDEGPRTCAARTGWRRPTPARPAAQGGATPPSPWDGLRRDRRPPSAPRLPGTRAPPRPLTEARPAPPPPRPTSPPPPPFSFCWDGSRVDGPAAVQPPAASAPRNGSSYNS